MTIDDLINNQNKYVKFLTKKVDKSTAEDIFNDCILKIYRINGMDYNFSKAYFYKILQSKLYDHFKSSSKLKVIPLTKDIDLGSYYDDYTIHVLDEIKSEIGDDDYNKLIDYINNQRKLPITFQQMLSNKLRHLFYR